MDRVRFGRALGYGARHAVRTLAQAVDAATSPDPAPSGTRPPPQNSPASPVPARTVSAPPLYEPPQARRVSPSAQQPQRTNRRSLWSPLRQFSKVIWLQVTGTFFAVFALFLGQGVWQLRGSIHAAPSTPEAQKLYFHAAVFAIFAYFTISSFVRASRRQRQ